MLLLLILIIRLTQPAVNNNLLNEMPVTTVSETAAEWTCTKNRNGIALYEKWVKVNDSLTVKERKGELIVSGRYCNVVQYLSQTATIKEWMSSVEVAKNIGNSNDSLLYVLFNLPWPFSNRDLIAHCQTIRLNEQYTIVKLESHPNALAPIEEAIRIKSYRASWEITLLTNGKIKVVLQTFSDEPPLCPHWIQDPIVEEIFYSNLARLKSKITDNQQTTTHERYSVVTGAGQGLGKAFPQVLASQQRNLLLITRPNEQIDLLTNELCDKHHIRVHYLEIDLAQVDAINQVNNWLQPFSIDMLVNNAGIGSATFIQEASVNHLDTIIQVNVRTFALLTHLLIPELARHPQSHIINISSLSSYTPVAYKTVYPASKSFVYSLSRSLSEELKDTSIHVSVVLPGPIKTNADVSARIDQQGWWVRQSLISPTDIATRVLKLTLKKRKVIIPGKINKFNWLMSRILPRGIQIPLLSRIIQKELLCLANIQTLKTQTQRLYTST
jgi:short-subunit dehydrogenase